MLADELAVWHEQHVAAYVEDRVTTGESPEEARRIVDEQHAQYFPDGRPAPGHEMLVAEMDGVAVGIAWWGPHPRRPQDRTAAWVYDIELAEQHRGRGLGRGLLAAIEEQARGAGVRDLSLNVFAQNEPARRLYAGTGYREVTLTMTKSLLD